MKFLRLLALFFAILPCTHIAFGADSPTKKQAEVGPKQIVSMPTAQDWKHVDGKLDEIDKKIVELSEKSTTASVWQPLYQLFGTALGALIAVIIANRNLKFQDKLAENKAQLDSELARQKAGLDIGNSFAQWQLKQLSDLYGPLHALFQQSVGLYRHMNVVLVKKAPEKFRLQQATTGEGIDDGQVFEICVDGCWDRFRTVLHIDEVYGRRYGIEEYFDEIIKIGALITKVISEKAGYARPGSSELLAVFGRYLAHYSVLERLHCQVKTKLSTGGSSLDNEIVVDGRAAFPQEIHRLVEQDFMVINQELSEWRAKFLSSPSVTGIS